MRLLDLYCGAGGAAMGYFYAGFDDIVGVDIAPQPRYPFTFIQGDAVSYGQQYGREFDAVHASPPCQRYSLNTAQHGTQEHHADHIAKTRLLLLRLGLPYVIENVERAPLRDAVLLCGSMFGSARLRRHRLFESNVILDRLKCKHHIQYDCISVSGNTGGNSRRDSTRAFGTLDQWKRIMGIDWMTSEELAEAIPPVYTQFIGKQLIAYLREAA